LGCRGQPVGQWRLHGAPVFRRWGFHKFGQKVVTLYLKQERESTRTACYQRFSLNTIQQKKTIPIPTPTPGTRQIGVGIGIGIEKSAGRSTCSSSRPVGCIPCTTNDDRLCFLSFGDLIPDQFNKHRTREQGDGNRYLPSVVTDQRTWRKC
jgi:hypothetical protein